MLRVVEDLLMRDIRCQVVPEGFARVHVPRVSRKVRARHLHPDLVILLEEVTRVPKVECELVDLPWPDVRRLLQRFPVSASDYAVCDRVRVAVRKYVNEPCDEVG